VQNKNKMNTNTTHTSEHYRFIIEYIFPQKIQTQKNSSSKNTRQNQMHLSFCTNTTLEKICARIQQLLH